MLRGNNSAEVIRVEHNIIGTAEILYDIKPSNGKEVAWKQRRLITLRLAQAYKRINSPKTHRILDCAGYMEFRRYADNSMKLNSANFCQLRLCPTCSWRRSMKIFAQVSKIMGSIKDDYNFLFLTLTCKNVTASNLDKQIDILISGFKALCVRKQFKSAVRGWCRALEITYNWQSTEFHPHFHVILAVDKDYFTSDHYITQDDFCLMWQSCLNVDYKPICDIRTFTESEKGKGKEVAEVAKYCVKVNSIMANLSGIASYSQELQDEARRATDGITDEIVFTLDAVLRNRRLIGYGGIFKKKHKELNLDSDIDGDLIRTTGNTTQEDLPFEIERYRWHIGLKNYIKIEDDDNGEGIG